MYFLIQTINGRVKHDFSFILLESIEYQNWIRNDNSFKVHFSELEDILIPNCVPVGSVKFVLDYLNNHYGLIPKPINIPIELMDKEWTGRNVINGTEKDIDNKKFVKSNDYLKSFAEICKTAPKGNYQISDIINIESEWRAFVYNGELVGLQNYSGEFDIFPDVNKIKAMIDTYKLQPIAFTIDVGISDNNTVIIEVHDFYSCGLYGFSDHRFLPFMFSKWFYTYINKNLK
jgi:hypothetical protein